MNGKSSTLTHNEQSFRQVRKAEFNNDVYVTHFGINILTNMTEVVGRVLTAPKIQYGGRVSFDETLN